MNKILGITRIVENSEVSHFALTRNEIVITPESIQIDKVYSSIIGCKMNIVALEVERERYMSNPFVELTQNLNFKPFSQNPTSNGIDIV